jgi:hypothetical protein
MSYLYETHLHTSQVSAACETRGRDYVAVYRDLGYTGIFVTDHFLGNIAGCKVDRNLPWGELVKRFCEGYEDARNEGAKRGLDVFFAWEETFDTADDYLIYGLDKEWLLEHPEARSWTRKEQYEAVKKAGGAVIQAHPFRQRNYIKAVHLSTGCVDGVEAANRGNDEEFDALAMRYSRILGLPVTAGSDIHDVKVAINGQAFGVYLKEKIESPAGYVKAIRENGIESLHIPAGRCDLKGTEDIVLPVDIRDENDRSTT